MVDAVIKLAPHIGAQSIFPVPFGYFYPYIFLKL